MTSQLLHIRFQPDKVRLEGLGFKDRSCCDMYITKLKQLLKMHFFIMFDFRLDSFSKMDHFEISFASSIFSKSWEVTNYGFLGVAHLPVSLIKNTPPHLWFQEIPF